VDAVPLIAMKAVSKFFGAVRALEGVDFEVMPGEVVGLVGDNAAGKSTLMKVLSGAHVPDEGELWVNGKPARIATPQDARALGIEMLYQHFALAGNISIYQNVYLGRELTTPYLGGLIRVLDKRRMEARAAEVLGRLRIRVDSVRQKVKQLSGGQQQSVAIGRAISFNARLIIMDEPTANLGIKEVNNLLALIRRLKDEGVSVVFISHRLDDVFAVGDRVIVLKSGRRVGERRVAETTMDEVVRLIVGGEAMAA